MALMICFWNEILTKFKGVSKQLNGENVDLDRTALFYESLESFLMALRDEKQFSRLKAKQNQLGVWRFTKEISKEKRN